MPAYLLVLALLGFSGAAWAQAARLSLDLPTVVTYLWIAAWAMVGGVISFHQKVKQGAARWINLSELIGELGTSAFIGVITGLLFEAANAPAAMTYAAVGIAGHAGGRAIFWLEQVAQQTLEKKLGVGPVRNEDKLP
jgi:hypothetical protein